MGFLRYFGFSPVLCSYRESVAVSLLFREGKKIFQETCKAEVEGGLLLTLSSINIALSQSTFGVYDCYDIIFHVRFYTPHKTCVYRQHKI